MILEQLTIRQQQVIYERYVVGTRTDQQIADHLGICRSAVTRRHNRALNKLKTSTNLEHLLETTQKRNQYHT